jgi:hypothetical protein
MRLLRAIVTLGLLTYPIFSLWAQGNEPTVILEARDIKAELIEPPTFSGSFGVNLSDNAEALRNKKWLAVSFSFLTEEPVKGFIDEISFRIFIEAREFANLDDQEGQPVVLVGETTYINLPAKQGGTKHTGVFFVHPFAVERYGGSRGERAFKFTGSVKNQSNSNIRIEATLNGQTVLLDKQGQARYVDLLKDDEGWVAQSKRINAIVLSKDQSPWAPVWADRVPPNKIKGASN